MYFKQLFELRNYGDGEGKGAKYIRKFHAHIYEPLEFSALLQCRPVQLSMPVCCRMLMQNSSHRSPCCEAFVVLHPVP